MEFDVIKGKFKLNQFQTKKKREEEKIKDQFELV